MSDHGSGSASWCLHGPCLVPLTTTVTVEGTATTRTLSPTLLPDRTVPSCMIHLDTTGTSSHGFPALAPVTSSTFGTLRLATGGSPLLSRVPFPLPVTVGSTRSRVAPRFQLGLLSKVGLYQGHLLN